MRVVSFSVPTWFPSYEEPGGPPTPHEGLPAEALLTEQESAVFLCLATGASNRELAVELQLSVSTVKFHVVNIRAKLGGISRLQACLLAALARQGGRPADVRAADDRPAGLRPADGRPADDGPAGDAPAAESDAGLGDGGVSDGGAAAVPR
ncbi:response regulator transcription factor [Streptomyces virginiae]|uniref:response regulator transcription factor n=1 Tax=Streptomyces virginiae TaxID=1961 RepID=UPI003648F33C